MDVGRVTYSTYQLQKKFKHSRKFGVTSNWNTTTAANIFQSALHQHLVNSGTTRIEGVYRKNPAYLCIDITTRKCVVIGRGGVGDHQFISAWELSATQLICATNPPYTLGGG